MTLTWSILALVLMGVAVLTAGLLFEWAMRRSRRRRFCVRRGYGLRRIKGRGYRVELLPSGGSRRG